MVKIGIVVYGSVVKMLESKTIIEQLIEFNKILDDLVNIGVKLRIKTK